MKTLSQLQTEKDNLQGLFELTEALKYLSAAKMSKIKKKVLANRKFLQEALVTRTELQKYHIKIRKAKAEKKKKKEKSTKVTSQNSVLVIAIMSNQGLCGTFNAQLAKRIIKDFPEGEPDLVVLGKKGKSYFHKSKIAAKIQVENIPDTVAFEDLKDIFTAIPNYSDVFVYYNMFITAVKSEPTRSKFSATAEEENDENKKEEEGYKLSNVNKKDSDDISTEDEIARTYIVEPDLSSVYEYFQTVMAEAIFMQQVLESRLSEYNSRMLAMKEANDNIKDLLSDQKKESNRVRRARINQSLTEVFAGRALW